MLLRQVLRLTSLLIVCGGIALTGLTLRRAFAPPPILAVTAFDANSGTGSGLWLRDLNRQQRFQLLASDRLLYTLWLPSGEKLAYFFDDSAGTAIYLYELATGRTTLGPVIPRLVPLSWSPDAQYLLLYNFSTNELVVMPYTDGQLGEPVYLAAGSADAVWSPDSQRIFYRDVAATLSVITVNCISGQQFCIGQPVPTDRNVTQLAGWMPDGERLMVFSNPQESEQPDLYALDATSGVSERIAQSLLPGTLPAWSPDGALLALSLALPTTTTASTDSEPIPGVYIVTENERPQLLWTGIAGQLGWSPDGDRLAFELVTRVGNDRSVWVFEREGRRLTRITPAGEHEATPAWVTYRGQPLDMLPLLALGAALALWLWFTRPRHI